MDYCTPTASLDAAYDDSQRIRGELEAGGVVVQGVAYGAGVLTFTTETEVSAELQATLALTVA